MGRRKTMIKTLINYVLAELERGDTVALQIKLETLREVLNATEESSYIWSKIISRVCGAEEDANADV